MMLPKPNRKREKARRDREKKQKTIAWHREVCAEGRCSVCKKQFSPEMLCGHHIRTKSARPELRFDPDNGIPVCLVCHNLIHSGNVKVDSADQGQVLDR